MNRFLLTFSLLVAAVQIGLSQSDSPALKQSARDRCVIETRALLEKIQYPLTLESLLRQLNAEKEWHGTSFWGEQTKAAVPQTRRIFYLDDFVIDQIGVYGIEAVQQRGTDGRVVVVHARLCFRSSIGVTFFADGEPENGANQALVPTVMSVTPAADAPVAPATTAAHL